MFVQKKSKYKRFLCSFYFLAFHFMSQDIHSRYTLYKLLNKDNLGL